MYSLVGGEVLGQLKIVHPLQEFRPVRVGYAENFAQRVERQARGERLDHVALPLRRHVVDHACDFVRNLRLQGIQVGRRKEWHVFAAQLEVLRRVEVDHGVERRAAEQHMARARLGRVHQDAATLGRKRAGVAVDAHDVGVPCHSPEAGKIAGLGVPANRRRLTQARKCFEWLAVRKRFRVVEAKAIYARIGLPKNRPRPALDGRLADQLHALSFASPFPDNTARAACSAQAVTMSPKESFRASIRGRLMAARQTPCGQLIPHALSSAAQTPGCILFSRPIRRASHSARAHRRVSSRALLFRVQGGGRAAALRYAPEGSSLSGRR